MPTNIRKIQLTAALAMGLAGGSLQAGGPLFLFEADTPYAWDVSSPVQVYTDLGDLCDTNDEDWYFYGTCQARKAVETVSEMLDEDE